MPEIIDVSPWLSSIGQSIETDDHVTAKLVHNFSATLGDYLAPTDSEGDAPLGLQWCLATLAPPMSSLARDGGGVGSGFLPDIPLPRRMAAGGELTYLKPIRIGDPVVRRSTVEDLVPKSGKTGQLVFLKVRHDFLVRGEVAVSEMNNVVFREEAKEADAARTPPAPPQPEPAEKTWVIEASTPLLFRYSALTFNAHRIHYDRPWATGQEGYSGLVVHGPLQATLALNLAAVMGGRTPTRFAYRNGGMLTDGGPFEVRGRREADGSISTWTATPDGRKGLTATSWF